MITHFQNKFGSVALRPVSEVAHVSAVHGKNLDARIMFDVETAEKLALITGNHRIQICPFKGADGWRCYVVLHETPSTVAVVEIETMAYTGGVPAAELHNAREDVQWVA